MKIKQGIMLSAIIDKLEIKIANAEAGQKEVGADLMMQVVTRAHKAADEIYEFVANVKKCSVEEAQDIDLIPFIKDLAKDSGMRDFLSSAVKSELQE